VAAEGAKGISLPKVSGAYVGQELNAELRDRIYREGARTAPGREHGGNIDIASLTRGSKMYLVSYYISTGS
jgi:formamidase